MRPTGASMDAAIAQAAHDTLVALFPSQKAHCDALLAEELAADPRRARQDGRHRARPARRARAILALRGERRLAARRAARWASATSPATGPASGARIPISRLPVALGAHWGDVAPFVLPDRANQFRVPPPPALTSRGVRRGVRRGEAPRRRRRHDADRAHRGPDASPASTGPTTARRACARRRGCTTRSPCTIADQMGIERRRAGAAARAGQRRDGGRRHRELGVEVLLRVLAAGHRHPRVRPGHRADRRGDGNPRTIGDPTFSPLGAPASNLHGPELHAAVPGLPVGPRRFGGALFQTLRRFYGTDDIPFTFVSDEFNGVTRDNDGNVRPLMPRTFTTLRRRRRRTARAASTSASTGRSTRPRASLRAGASPTTSSRTRFGDDRSRREVHRRSLHDSRSATTGSTRVARRAGSQLASRAAAARTAAAPVMLIASSVPMPYSYVGSGGRTSSRGRVRLPRRRA